MKKLIVKTFFITLFFSFYFSFFGYSQYYVNNKVDTNSVYTVVEYMPQPVENWSGFEQYLREQISQKNYEKKGTVKISFIVQKDGTLTDFKVLKRLTPLQDSVAIELVQKTSPWKYATHRGYKVKVMRFLDIKF